MTGLYRFLASSEALIYIVLAIGGLFAFRWLWSSWREWQQSAYRLEREFALRRMSQAFALSLVVLILLCAEFVAASFIIPGLPAQVFIPTPTLDLLALPSGTLSPEMMTRVAAATPAAASANMQGCIPGEIFISSPKPGEDVKGKIEITGTVNIADFGFYKYEVAPRGSETWATIAADTKPKKEELLGAWDTTALTPGDYQLRIVVTDHQGEALPACIIPIRVLAP
jgi:hypothetical protein